MFGLAAVFAMVCASAPLSRFMGWVGFGICLILHGQTNLSRMHFSIPILLGLIASAATGMIENFDGDPAANFVKYTGEAGMFITLITLPFSLLRLE